MPNTAPFLAGGGELGALMRGKDWSHSPAGPPEVWPEAIKSTVALCLGSSTPIIVWIGSRSDRLIQLYNDAYRPVMGAEKHPWGLGRLGAEVWPEIWRDIMTPIFDEVLLNGRSVRRDDQYMVLHRNGYPEETWFTHYHSPLREADGTIVGVFTVVIEVSEQKRAERALRGLNEHLEAQVAARTEDRDRMWRLSTDVMLVADFDARIVSVNPAWTALFGWDEIELLSRNFLDLVHPDDREATLAETRKLEQGITTMRFENRYCQKDGGYRWISWTAVPDERFIHAVGRDITAEKAASIRLEEAQQALRQAQKMEAVGQLTGGIAHDFNNVLQAVAGGLDLIRRKPTDPDRVRQWAESSLEAADRGAKLTAQLLAFSRAQKLELKPVEINNLVERMKDLLGRTIGPDIRVNTVLSSELSAALGDATQIEMAVLNLTINARDAMPAGGHLMISTGRRIIKHAADLSAGDYIELSVEDTGTGMTPEVIERAFDPFFTTKGVGQGTGLGLSQVYGMARQAGGTVRIDSEVGRGTKVSIFLRATSEQFENLAAKTYTVDQITPARVLVVDDDISVRRFLIETLQALGYAAHEAENGREALTVLNDFRPDVAIVDFAMPDINGAQVAREIRAQRPGTAIVFASGFSDTNAIETAVGQQAVLLRKPFRIEDLRQAIEQVLH